MKILIIGGSGHVSGAVARTALAGGHTVWTVTRGNRPLPEGVTSLIADRPPSDSPTRWICLLPDNVCDELGLWLGLVVDHDSGLILMTSILDEPPIVQDLLEILSRAVECPLPRDRSLSMSDEGPHGR